MSDKISPSEATIYQLLADLTNIDGFQTEIGVHVRQKSGLVSIGGHDVFVWGEGPTLKEALIDYGYKQKKYRRYPSKTIRWSIERSAERG